MTGKPSKTERRAFLRASAAAALGVGIGLATTVRANGEVSASSQKKVLLVYFSRPGENYFHGGRKDLLVGNTAVVGGFIRDALACDVFEIHASVPYSNNYDDTVERNVREQEESARPAIANMIDSIDRYDTILIGSPIWNVRPPRIMLTFAEHFDFRGKTIYPFTTYAMSRLGTAVDEYRKACRGATVGEALAVQGEEAAKSRADVRAWLRRVGLTAGDAPSTPASLKRSK
jgi:flavodoxin